MNQIDKYCQEKFLYGTTKNNDGVVRDSEESSD